MIQGSPWGNTQNILCIRLDSLGDVLMTTPAVRAIKDSGEGRRITLLASPTGAEIAPFIPEIDDLIVYEAPWMKATPTRKNSRLEYRMVETLRRQGFDAAVIFTVYSQNPLPAAFLCYLADIPLRLAYCRENPYQLLTDWVREIEPEKLIRHEVRRQLDLVQSVGFTTSDEKMSLSIPSDCYRTAQSKFERLRIDTEKPWIIIHPGASAPSRRYPAEKFALVARQLVKEKGIQVVFSGTKNEVPLVTQIQGKMDAVSSSLAGKLSLGELTAILSTTPLLLANNTGPVHVAAAIGTPVVDLYALTNPQHTPWGVPNRVINHDVPCKYCYKSVCPEGHHNCLEKVTPDEVVSAVCELLATTSAIHIPIK